jgi:hypothetical protein
LRDLAGHDALGQPVRGYIGQGALLWSIDQHDFSVLSTI